MQILKSIGNAIRRALPQLKTPLTHLLEETLPDLLDVILSLINTILTALPPLLETVLPLLIEAVAKIVELLVQQAPQWLTALVDLIPVIADILISNSGGILEAGKELVKKIADGLTEGAAWFEENGGEVIGKILDIITDLTDPSNIQKILGFAGNIIQKLGSGLVDSSKNIGEKAVDIITNIGLALTSEDTLGNLVTTAVGILDGLFNGLTSGESLNKIMDRAPDILSNIVTEIGNATAGLIEATGHILSNIFDWFKKPENKAKFKEGGEQIMIALGQALEDNLEVLSTFIYDIAQYIKDGVIDALLNSELRIPNSELF